MNFPTRGLLIPLAFFRLVRQAESRLLDEGHNITFGYATFTFCALSYGRTLLAIRPFEISYSLVYWDITTAFFIGQLYTLRENLLQWRNWLRQCATSRKVTGSIFEDVTALFH
jgi:hypothetical protein